MIDELSELEHFYSEEEFMSKNIYQRINAIMADVKYVQKEDKKVNNQYTFVSHDAVTKVVRESLVKHGVVILPTYWNIKENGNKVSCDISLKIVNVDKPDDFILNECAGFGFGIDNQDKAPGKAMSYAYKYALLKMFALETGDDPEKDSIEHKPDIPENLISSHKAYKEKIKQEIKECDSTSELAELQYKLTKNSFTDAEWDNLTAYIAKHANYLNEKGK